MTISCLLVYPNASSALNAEAGMLLEQDGGAGWDGFVRKAKLMTRLQAGVPKDLRDMAKEAQRRGEESEADRSKERQELDRKDSGMDEGSDRAEKLKKRRRDFALARGRLDTHNPPTLEKRTRTPSPVLPPSPVRATAPRPFVVQSTADDVFGDIRMPRLFPQDSQLLHNDFDSSEIQHASPEIRAVLRAPARPIFPPNAGRHGPSIPLEDLSIIDDRDSSSFDDTIDSEYPPSPKKSPVKQRRGSVDHYAEHPPSPRKESPRKKNPEYPPSPNKKQNPVPRLGLPRQGSDAENMFAPPPRPDLFRAESSRTAALRAGASRLLFTPNNQMHPALLSSATPDAGETDESEFEMSFEILRQSERKKKNLLSSPPKRKVRTRTTTPREGPFDSLQRLGSVNAPPASHATPVLAAVKKSPPRAVSGKSAEERKREVLEAKLWKMCGGDVERWNRGDFGGFLKFKASRW